MWREGESRGRESGGGHVEGDDPSLGSQVFNLLSLLAQKYMYTHTHTHTFIWAHVDEDKASLGSQVCASICTFVLLKQAK
jgi:hypothetical protein